MKIAKRYGWLPGARYTNLRDIRTFDEIGFIDIDWSNYCFKRHMEAVKSTRPVMTVARDVTSTENLDRILDEAAELNAYARFVAIVPKDPSFTRHRLQRIATRFVLAYSVPTRYGGTTLPLSAFPGQVHLLGGRPDVQRGIASKLKVMSVDCNRFTFDAAYGDFFDGETFRPHPKGGYDNCVRDSIRNINKLWSAYSPTYGATNGR